MFLRHSFDDDFTQGCVHNNMNNNKYMMMFMFQQLVLTCILIVKKRHLEVNVPIWIVVNT